MNRQYSADIEQQTDNVNAKRCVTELSGENPDKDLNSRVKRVPWSGSRILTFYDVEGHPYQRKVLIDRVIGMGASCICYAVEADFGDENIHKMILKQFCPEPMMSVREKEHLAVLFEQAYVLQNDLANIDELMDLIVRPYEKYFSDTERYILYEANYGDSLEKREAKDLKMQLRVMQELSAALQRLHSYGIVHMDLKPENILWTEYGGIKFFDFDAAIILNRIEEVHEIRGDMENRGLLAPELRDMSEFEQNKKLLLHPRVDIYAVGAMLFFWFFQCFPTEWDNESSGNWELRLQELFDTRFRGELNEAQQQLLVHILQKSTDISIGRRGRYRKAGEMATDLKVLLQEKQSAEMSRQEQICEVNYRLLAAYFLWKHPLYPYISEGMDGKQLDVVLFGSAPIRESFFLHIFSCVQIPELELRIHIAAEDAYSFAQSLLLQFPQLKTTVEMIFEDEVRPLSLDTEITSKPLARLYFYNCTETAEAGAQWMQEWIHRMEEQHPERIILPYMILHMADGEQNYQMADQMNQSFSMREWKEPSVAFLGYGDDRGDGYRLRSHKSLPGHLQMDVFGMNAKYSIEEKDFEHDIGKLAFFIHCYYAKEWNPDCTEEELKNQFYSEPYLIHSSMRSALSVPYKLFCAGIAVDENASERFRQGVLEKKDTEPGLYKRMLAMEHKSWLCFMIMEGYQRPSEKVLRKYAFSGRNDQRDRRHKLHPCISEFRAETGMPLSKLSKNEWDLLTAVDMKGDSAEAWCVYDALDRVSLLLHQICENKTRRLDLSAQFEKLREELELEEAGEVLFQELRKLQKTYHAMLDGLESANERWENTCDRFEHLVRKLEEEQGLYDEEILDAFQMIREDMRVVVERNRYHDYKKSDESILYAIPELLKQM